MTDSPAEAEGPGEPAEPAPGTEPGEERPSLGRPGRPFDRRAPYLWGLLVGLGLLTAFEVGRILVTISGVLVQIVVSLFIAAGLNPLVMFLERRGLRRSLAVLVVIIGVLAVTALFLLAFVPVITDQVKAIASNAPTWLSRLQHNRRIQQIDEQYHIIEKTQSFLTGGHFVSTVFGGVLGIGLRVLNAFFNVFVITVMTLYFLASYEATKRALFRLAPASRRERVTAIGERVFAGIGGYVSGAFVIALCAGVSSLIFLFAVGMSKYAVALSFVVMIMDVIPMIGATIGAAIVCAICFATDIRTGIIAVIFYIVYQQTENYLLYPRIMSHSVAVPGLVTIIAALVGASLLGVVGALLAIPTAAALLTIIREVWVRAQDER